MCHNEDIIKVKPFLRWAGGKGWLINHLDILKNQNFNNYHEPFLGGGSVFFSFDNYKKAYLSDLNNELIETYICLRDKLEDVIGVLKTFKNTEKEYYRIRSKVFTNDYERAAKFIFLNKTSFNGIYRVNRNGGYNVPYGYRSFIKDIVDRDNLIMVNKKLQGVRLKCQDFNSILKKVKPDDLVFLDPPYTVAHENNGFIAYNQKLFSLEDQKKLSVLIEKIIEIGAFYILTNAKHKAIKEIYNNINTPFTLSRNSTIGGIGARREKFKEYVFSNCL